jgi:pimeloyl-ACP methyl ester carboxylesterase
MAAFGGDVAAVVDAAGAHRVVLIGHSMGGAVVLEAARRMPGRVKGVVLVDMFLDFEQKMQAEEIDAVVSRLETDYAGVTRQMAETYMFTPHTPPAVRARVHAAATSMRPELSIELMRQTWSYDPVPAARSIDAPIRAVNSDKFPTNEEANRRHAPGYRAFVVPGTGHYLLLEEPALFASSLEQALADLG